MARTWSTFNAPPQWGKIQGIPADFSDGKIDWDEIANKPNPMASNGYYSSSNNIHLFSENYKNLLIQSIPYAPENDWARIVISHNTYFDSQANKWKRQNYDGNCNLSMISFSPGWGRLIATNDVFNSNPSDSTSPQMFMTNVCLTWSRDAVQVVPVMRLLNLPSSPLGLATGTIWKDSNGFLRAV